MKTLSLFSRFLSTVFKGNHKEGVSSYRYHGRWYGMMCCLGEQSGRNMPELIKEKGSEVLTMLELSNEYPEDFKYINQLLNIQKQKKDEKIEDDAKQKDYLLGAVEAKKVYLHGKQWSVLLQDHDIDFDLLP